MKRADDKRVKLSRRPPPPDNTFIYICITIISILLTVISVFIHNKLDKWLLESRLEKMMLQIKIVWVGDEGFNYEYNLILKSLVLFSGIYMLVIFTIIFTTWKLFYEKEYIKKEIERWRNIEI
jgi:hypothetical protein